MPTLLLGPILRHIGVSDATVWVETDRACEVGVLDAVARTFEVEGHHYAIVAITGLEPGSVNEYAVELDGERAWPLPDSTAPPSAIRTVDPSGEVRILFGSCRISLPHEPPFVLDPSEDKRGHGVDALRCLALRMRGVPPQERPDTLLMLGDQIYADELSPAMRRVTELRGPSEAPKDELEGFSEYALAYREAWGEPVVRWLLSTVPTAMVFDDHEIHAEWKISQAWLDDHRAQLWYDGRIASGLTAYWVYQHLGNLSPAELEQNELLLRARELSDAGPFLQGHMRTADRQPGHSRWSYRRDLGHARLVVVDSRAGREVAPGRRRMIDEDEWDWIVDSSTGDFEHLLLASSVPFILTHGLHHAEAWNEAVASGAWGEPAARLAERIRRALVMDHWASFQRSFTKLAALLEELATGARGSPPSSIVMLSGDVHHCYLAEVGFRLGTGARSTVWQAVCSAYRKQLTPKEKLAMRLGRSRSGAVVSRILARGAGVMSTSLGWRLVEPPTYDNQIATLELSRGSARVRVETTAGSDWREPTLRRVFERELAPGGAAAPADATRGARVSA